MRSLPCTYFMNRIYALTTFDVRLPSNKSLRATKCVRYQIKSAALFILLEIESQLTTAS